MGVIRDLGEEIAHPKPKIHEQGASRVCECPSHGDSTRDDEGYRGDPVGRGPDDGGGQGAGVKERPKTFGPTAVHPTTDRRQTQRHPSAEWR